MNDKQATPEREPGFYWILRLDKWQVAECVVTRNTCSFHFCDGTIISEASIDIFHDEIVIGERIERPTPDGGWVDVRERLPEDDDVVIGFHQNSNPEWRIVFCVFQNNGFYRNVDVMNGERVYSARYTNITHWKPMPPPPQRVETNNP